MSETPSLTGPALRRAAHELAAPLPPLLAEAEHLASTVMMGDHGRRRAGLGDTFWQFRPAEGHDETRDIDWRRSAMSDVQFVRQKEWQVAQTVVFWVDRAASMSFTSLKQGPTKAHRAAVIALATGCPVIPVGQWGAHEVLPPYTKRPHLVPRKNIVMKAGDPVPLDDLVAAPPSPETTAQATERIMTAITALVADLRGETPPTDRFDPRRSGVRETGNPYDPHRTKRKRTR